MGVEGQRSPSETSKRARLQKVKSVPAVEIYRPPAARRAKNNPENNVEQSHVHHAATELSFAKNNRQRRPDRAVYVPRHRRSLTTDGSPQPSDCRTGGTVQEDSTSSPSSQEASKSQAPCRKAQEDSCCDQRGSESAKKGSNVNNCTKRSITMDNGQDRIPCCTVNSESAAQPDLHDGTPTHFVDLCSIEIQSPDILKEIDEGTDNPKKNVPSISQLEKSATCTVEGRSENDEADPLRCTEVNVSNGSPDKSLCNIEENSRTVEASVNEIDRTLNRDVYIEDNIDENTLDKNMMGYTNNMSLSIANDKKADQEVLNHDEIVNHRNKQIVQRNMISDVLIISDSTQVEPKKTKEVSTVPITSPEKKVKKIERQKSKAAPPPSPPIKINREECDWDSLFDDNGDCLDPSLIEELTSAVGEVTIEQPKNDYKAYSKQIEVSSDEFAHVVEIYNFPSDFKTSDLAAVFSPFKNGGFELKWVDDTHCLGVFSSPLIAAEVLASDHPFVKTRPLSEATALSKTKARRSAEFLQPYRSRPKTCAALARRLVTGALGVKLATARQEREHEKNVLREAKEKRRIANKQREDAWEGIIPEK